MGHGVHASLSRRDDQGPRRDRLGGGPIQNTGARRLSEIAIHTGHPVRSATEIEHHATGDDTRHHQVNIDLFSNPKQNSYITKTYRFVIKFAILCHLQ